MSPREKEYFAEFGMLVVQAEERETEIIQIALAGNSNLYSTGK